MLVNIVIETCPFESKSIFESLIRSSVATKVLPKYIGYSELTANLILEPLAYAVTNFRIGGRAFSKLSVSTK